MVVLNREEFLKQIELAARSAPKDQPVEVLRSLCFRSGLLLSYNQKCGTVQKCAIGADFLIPPDRLVPVIKSMVSDEVSLDVKGSTLHVKGGRTTVKIGTSDAKGFPHFLPKEKSVYYSGTDFRNACSAVLFCAVANKNMPSLSGVGLRGTYAYGADPGARIARAKLKGEVHHVTVLTADGVEELHRMGDTDEILHDGNNLHALWKDPSRLAVFGTLQDKQYPFNTLDGVFAKATNPIYDVTLPKDMAKVVARVLAPTSGPAKAVELKVRLVGGTLYLPVSGQGVESEDSVECGCAHCFDFNVTASYFMDAVKQFSVMNVEDVVAGDSRIIRFAKDGLEHVLALRAS